MIGRIEIELSSIRARHEGSFAVDRPKGNGLYAFVHFSTPIYLRDSFGMKRCDKNAAILYGPTSRTWYSGYDTDWENTWFHCGGDVASYAEHFGIPLDSAIQVGALSSLPAFLNNVRRERLRREPYCDDAVAILTEEFFFRLGRTIAQLSETHLTAAQQEQLEALRRVRETVHSRIDYSWKIADMAGLANLSPSRFAALYHAFFGVSPMEDLIESRLSTAESMLRRSSHTTSFIAEKCGFSSLSHFSRTFRNRKGVRPGSCRSEVL